MGSGHRSLFTVHRSPRSIGIYHLSAAGHTSRYEFAQAIIRIMKEVSGIPEGWASVNPVRGPASNGVKPITTAEYPLPAKGPRHPLTGVS